MCLQLPCSSFPAQGLDTSHGPAALRFHPSHAIATACGAAADPTRKSPGRRGACSGCAKTMEPSKQIDAASQRSATMDLAVQTACVTDDAGSGSWAQIPGPKLQDVCTQTPPRSAKRKLLESCSKTYATQDVRPCSAAAAYGQGTNEHARLTATRSPLTACGSRGLCHPRLVWPGALSTLRCQQPCRDDQMCHHSHIKRQRTPPPPTLMSPITAYGSTRACPLEDVLNKRTIGHAVHRIHEKRYLPSFPMSASGGLSAAQLAHAPPSIVRQVMASSGSTADWPMHRLPVASWANLPHGHTLLPGLPEAQFYHYQQPSSVGDDLGRGISLRDGLRDFGDLPAPVRGDNGTTYAEPIAGSQYMPPQHHSVMLKRYIQE
eukprot:jgi/Ulvmu1/3167/UM015_0208.1